MESFQNKDLSEQKVEKVSEFTMANALKRGPLVQLLKSIFTGGADETTTATTTSYSMSFPDVGEAVEGMQSYVQNRLSKLEHLPNGSWLSHFVESVFVIGVAVALIIVYRDDQKWAKVVSLLVSEIRRTTPVVTMLIRYPQTWQ